MYTIEKGKTVLNLKYYLRSQICCFFRDFNVGFKNKTDDSSGIDISDNYVIDGARLRKFDKIAQVGYCVIRTPHSIATELFYFLL